MPAFGLRKNSFYSVKSEEEMNPGQEDSVQQLRMEATQACSSLAEGVQQLRDETSQVCSNIVSGVVKGVDQIKERQISATQKLEKNKICFIINKFY